VATFSDTQEGYLDWLFDQLSIEHHWSLSRENKRWIINVVIKALNHMTESASVAWMFNASHQSIKSEWPVSDCQDETANDLPIDKAHDSVDVANQQLISNRRIDLVFVDQENQAWIIDYKLVFADDANPVQLNAQQQQELLSHYQEQLQVYQGMVETFYAESSHRLRSVSAALYLPLSDQLITL